MLPEHLALRRADIQAEQVPHLVGYIVNVRVADNLASKPDWEPE